MYQSNSSRVKSTNEEYINLKCSPLTQPISKLLGLNQSGKKRLAPQRTKTVIRQTSSSILNASRHLKVTNPLAESNLTIPHAQLSDMNKADAQKIITPLGIMRLGELVLWPPWPTALYILKTKLVEPDFLFGTIIPNVKASSDNTPATDSKRKTGNTVPSETKQLAQNLTGILKRKSIILILPKMTQLKILLYRTLDGNCHEQVSTQWFFNMLGLCKKLHLSYY